MMGTINCPKPNVLADYMLGRVSEADLASISDHIETCSICQSHLETLDGLSDTVVKSLRRLDVGEIASDNSLLNNLLSRFENIQPESAADSHDQVGPTNELALPQQIGQYQLLEKLGQGGMGTVYRALHAKLKCEVAIKLLPSYRQRSPQAVIRFHREMEALGRMDHPNIVRAHDAGEYDGQFFLAMEYVEGANLSALMHSSGPLKIVDACEIVRQAAVGLQHAHEHGLVHRDVKPSNLMLTNAGIVKVLDLGLARSLVDEDFDGETTASGQILGSPDYMAPEQVSNSREADARADVYALGCTLYFLLAGRPPFGDKRHNTFLEKVMAHANGKMMSIQQCRPGVPSSLAAVLDSMLARNPIDRCLTAAEVTRQLTPFCGGSDLIGLLANHKTNTPATSPKHISDPATPENRPTPPNAVVSLVAPHRMVWLIVLGLLIFVAATLWYGMGALGKRSDNATQMPAQNPKNTELAQLPAGVQSVMKAACGAQDKNAASQNVETVSTYLRNASIPEHVQAAMLTVVWQHPAEIRWSGRAGTTLFGIAAKPLPKEQMRQRTLPAMLELTHMLAIHELLTAKSLLDRYATMGLTDATTLRQAVVESSGQLQVTGKTGTVTHQTTTVGELLVGYATADEAALSTQLLQPDELEKVRISYRDVMHRQARELMRRSNWADALLLWQHLHKRKLVSQQLYLDAAQCFKQLNRSADMLRVLAEAIDAFGTKATPEFFEKAGDMALAVENDQAQVLAEKAYRMASERLQNTVSFGPKETTEEISPTQ